MGLDVLFRDGGLYLAHFCVHSGHNFGQAAAGLRTMIWLHASPAHGVVSPLMLKHSLTTYLNMLPLSYIFPSLYAFPEAGVDTDRILFIPSPSCCNTRTLGLFQSCLVKPSSDLATYVIPVFICAGLHTPNVSEDAPRPRISNCAPKTSMCNINPIQEKWTQPKFRFSRLQNCRFFKNTMSLSFGLTLWLVQGYSFKILKSATMGSQGVARNPTLHTLLSSQRPWRGASLSFKSTREHCNCFKSKLHNSVKKRKILAKPHNVNSCFHWQQTNGSGRMSDGPVTNCLMQHRQKKRRKRALETEIFNVSASQSPIGKRAQGATILLTFDNSYIIPDFRRPPRPRRRLTGKYNTVLAQNIAPSVSSDAGPAGLRRNRYKLAFTSGSAFLTQTDPALTAAFAFGTMRLSPWAQMDRISLAVAAAKPTFATPIY
ncbi:hypothetical protein B0H16DRAFT_1878887 [Mycena metata]|uniref:Uncharacterized protein n=1 Tax=Mycena metata TaxID=1033252 RepID=A0AAD7K4U8_9AGAR|nr:hypothetical protein B0H16DRAFT_1878887 [Mycena metata]